MSYNVKTTQRQPMYNYDFGWWFVVIVIFSAFLIIKSKQNDTNKKRTKLFIPTL